LTRIGRSEVETSVTAAAETLLGDPPLFIFMSPFLRTRQTAAIAETVLGVSPAIDPRLGERNFGQFELLSDKHYQEVWDLDPVNPTGMPGGVESVYQVAERTTELILEWESSQEFDTGLLVTHCDVAMVLSCVFQNLDPRLHRSLDPMKTGEIRLLSQ
jgi:broad specificity phosphatase PhoE